MKFAGLLLREGLKDVSVLDMIRGGRTVSWEVCRATDHRPRIWTTVYFEGDESNVDVVAEKLSRSLKPRRWCINISTNTHSYAIFPDRVFKYARGNKQSREEAQSHARSLGIPETQLDWGE